MQMGILCEGLDLVKFRRAAIFRGNRLGAVLNVKKFNGFKLLFNKILLFIVT